MLFYPIRINIQSALCVNYSIFQAHLYITLKINLQKKYNAEEEKLTQHIKEIFKNSRNNYGSRKINDKIDNKLKRNFNQEKRMKVIVSDLTYVNVAGKWNYICLMLDLYNREIVGYAEENIRMLIWLEKQ